MSLGLILPTELPTTYRYITFCVMKATNVTTKLNPPIPKIEQTHTTGPTLQLRNHEPVGHPVFIGPARGAVLIKKQ